jgi:hypothetical protein
MSPTGLLMNRYSFGPVGQAQFAVDPRSGCAQFVRTEDDGTDHRDDPQQGRRPTGYQE